MKKVIITLLLMIIFSPYAPAQDKAKTPIAVGGYLGAADMSFKDPTSQNYLSSEINIGPSYGISIIAFPESMLNFSLDIFGENFTSTTTELNKLDIIEHKLAFNFFRVEPMIKLGTSVYLGAGPVFTATKLKIDGEKINDKFKPVQVSPSFELGINIKFINSIVNLGAKYYLPLSSYTAESIDFNDGVTPNISDNTYIYTLAVFTRVYLYDRSSEYVNYNDLQ